jgi:hypothetical protein
MILLLKLGQDWQINMKFELTKEQLARFKEWDNNHRCDAYLNAIGERVSFKFTPTGLGMIVDAECICGEKLSLTESENW